MESPWVDGQDANQALLPWPTQSKAGYFYLLRLRRKLIGEICKMGTMIIVTLMVTGGTEK